MIKGVGFGNGGAGPGRLTAEGARTRTVDSSDPLAARHAHGCGFTPRMVPVMRRTIVTFSMLGLFGAALGCQHIGGKCDCWSHPSDAEPVPIGNPYPYAAVGGVTAVPQIPPASNGGSDAKPPKPTNPGKTTGKLPQLETEVTPNFKPAPGN